jgi:hypothetical protein
MKDNLKDLIQHVQLEGVDLIKVSGTDKETKVAATAEDKSVIVFGTFKNPISDFMGIFGMPNLGKLKTILSFDDYDDKSVINVTRANKDGVDVPVAIHFETQDKSFVNDYRLMAKTIVEEKVKEVTFKGVSWDVEFEPTIAGIQRLKKQQQANSEESHFTATTVNGDLKFNFGDPSTHSGNFVFHPSVGGALNRGWKWPVKQFIAIMDLPGDKKVKISDKGATEITVDSGIAVYQYLLPAQTK